VGQLDIVLQMILTQQDAKSLDLSFQVNEFKAICTSWQKYKDELKDVASIGVRHVKW
jgi:poly(A) polymerase